MSSDGLHRHPALPLPVAIRRIATARVMRLRLDHGGTMLKLTIPRRVSERSALAWAAEQQGWVSAQLAKRPEGLPLRPGARIPFDGGELELVHAEGRPRAIRLVGTELHCGGPLEGLERRVLLWLRNMARDRLSAEVAAIAREAGVTVASVAVGDPVSRWGSCSAAGALRFSWRLILASPGARRFVVAHEVAHRLHMDHGPQFRAAERRLFGGDVAAARAELRLVAPRLRAVGRL
ncbi:M48 family metallopeptidase [Sphingomonas ginkgonis]|uniref:M48 family metallopeptidase n=1 Tax=Sphingomonas ginkgonis TaxID=2315330 RepID=UPI001EF02EA4|nr:YgjP-like metallopeptidase domain-containing protein [Sphingomonas ginkgonis]